MRKEATVRLAGEKFSTEFELKKVRVEETATSIVIESEDADVEFYMIFPKDEVEISHYGYITSYALYGDTSVLVVLR